MNCNHSHLILTQEFGYVVLIQAHQMNAGLFAQELILVLFHSYVKMKPRVGFYAYLQLALLPSSAQHFLRYLWTEFLQE